MKTEMIYFSATGTTKAIVKAISQGLSGEIHFTDITLPESRKNEIKVNSDLVLLAVPIYGEKIPPFLFKFLQQIKGNGTPLAVVAVYGNMGFGISLNQFKELAETNRFNSLRREHLSASTPMQRRRLRSLMAGRMKPICSRRAVLAKPFKRK